MKKVFVLSVIIGVVLVLGACERTGRSDASEAVTPTIKSAKKPADKIPAILPDLSKKELHYSFEGNHSPSGTFGYIHVDVELVKSAAIDSSEFGRGSDFANKLGVIDGVEYVSLYRYKVAVSKGAVFEWKDIVSKVVEVIRKERTPNAKAIEKLSSTTDEDTEENLRELLKKYWPSPSINRL